MHRMPAMTAGTYDACAALYAGCSIFSILDIMQIPAELLSGSQQEAVDTEPMENSKAYAGVEGGAAISQEARLPADLKFGSIKQRTVDDAVALRRKLAMVA